MIEYRCKDCDKRLFTSPEVGEGESVFVAPTAILNLHHLQTGHENFAAEAQRSTVTISVMPRSDNRKDVMISGTRS